jgi:hypothetical protein
VGRREWNPCHQKGSEFTTAREDLGGCPLGTLAPPRPLQSQDGISNLQSPVRQIRGPCSRSSKNTLIQRQVLQSTWLCVNAQVASPRSLPCLKVSLEESCSGLGECAKLYKRKWLSFWKYSGPLDGVMVNCGNRSSDLSPLGRELGPAEAVVPPGSAEGQGTSLLHP